VLCHEREAQAMKMNQYGGDSEPSSVLYSANARVDRTDEGQELDRAGHNRVFSIDNSPRGAVASAIANRGPFPLRTLMVCFTIWLIATQAMIFDQVKFDERVRLLKQEARSFGGPQGTVRYERPSHLSTGEEVQRL